jgi:uncharacterized protein YjiS (DUF1127 family)
MHSDFTHDSAAPIRSGSGQPFVLRWFALLMARRRRAATRASLDRLDARMLRDVGLRRDQLTGTLERLPHLPRRPMFL